MVGAGIIGASIAWRLVDAGMKVSLYDAGSFAGEASTAAAGMLAPGGEVTHLGGWALDTVEARALYRAWAQQLEAASGHNVDFLECGAIDLAFNDTEWAGILKRREMLRQLGIRTEVLTENQLREKIPGLTTESCRALYFPDDALVSPLDVAKALRLVLDSCKVEIREHTPVASCRWNRDRFTLIAPNGSQLTEADAVVLAAGAWSGKVHLDIPPQPQAEPLREVLPVRGHMIYCHRDPGTLGGPIVRHNHLYVLQRTNGSVLVGSSEERIGFDRNLNPVIVDDLLHRTRRILPSLFPEQPNASWVGFRPGISGSGPEVRQLGELPLWLAYGHYRNGILLAPHTAQKVAAGIEALAARPA